MGSMVNRENKRWLGVLLVALACVCWGSYGIYVKKLSQIGFSNFDTIEIKSAIAAVFCGLYILFTNPKLFRIKLKDIWCFLGAAVLNMMLNGICYAACIIRSSMGFASILCNTGPMWALVLSCIIFKEKFTVKKLIAVILTFTGCVLATDLSGTTNVTAVAVILGLLAGLGWSMFSVFSRFALNKGYSSMTITFYSVALCTVICSFFTDWNKVITAAAVPSNLVWMIMIGLVTGFIGYVVYTSGLKYIETGVASILCALEPTMAIIYGVLLFNEKLTAPIVCGMALIFSGIVLVNVKAKKANEADK